MSFDFSESEVLRCLEQRGLKYKNGSRYIVTQCPTHDDKNPSAQIYKDDWFVNCNAGCGRYPIQEAFPELTDGVGASPAYQRPAPAAKNQTMSTYKEQDLSDWWRGLPLIPRDHKFKTIPLEVLDDLGWRWDEPKNSYFIPYFDSLREGIPFGQWRHLQGERRFTFLKDAHPTCYGTWNIADGNKKIFIVEGASDAAVMEHIMVPWVALPSASSAELIKKMAAYCTENGISLIYAGDNDSAGDKLLEALDSVAPYRLRKPPATYKDWGDFLEAEGFDTVQEWCFKELFRKMPVENNWWEGAKEALDKKDADSAKQQPTAAESAILY